MSKKRLIYVCNAFEDETRLERGITTDSPAASKKIFQISESLKISGVSVTVLSLGRGRSEQIKRFYKFKLKRHNNLSIIYLPFSNIPIFSEFLTLITLPIVLLKLNKASTVLFYNRMAAYFLGLVLARFLYDQTVLDLEDGQVTKTNTARISFYCSIFDFFINRGAVLACQSLSESTNLRPVIPCYGVTQRFTHSSPAFVQYPIRILFGGTVSIETGSALLLETLRLMRREKTEWITQIEFVVTGKGDSLVDFVDLSRDQLYPRVTVLGRLTDKDYEAVLRDTHIGLALKLNNGELANTTFPSKVIEFSSNGILVLTTNISDVRSLLGSNAVYLNSNSPYELADLFKWIVEHPNDLKNMALSAQKHVSNLCDPVKVGSGLGGFFWGSK